MSAPAKSKSAAGARKRPALKVFRTAIGFHDAYVAAPSRKAALEAWGARGDLFARGQAEQVDDTGAGAEALATPGKVVRRLRGSASEQIAALPPDAPAQERPRKPAKAVRNRPAPPPKPNPSAREAARTALAEMEARHREQRDALTRRQAALDRERERLTTTQTREIEAARARAERADKAYEAAMQGWREAVA